ncbi:MAG: hypothetical protein J6N49_02660 [Alphaproteobacteria bacterium]|nr:hypothetical protein [Alphaproteobacteria bacterium]
MPENENNTIKQQYHQHPRQDSALVRFLKPIWGRFKKTKLFQAYRHSRLNPFHTTLQKIKADTVEDAREIAINKNLRYFEYNGVRVSTDEPYSLATEAGKRKRIFRNGRNALDVLPRNAQGVPDLMAEEPIVIAILPIEGPSLIGHAALQYKDMVVNRMRYKMDTKPLLPRYGNKANYYLIYPSQIGIDPKQLVRAIEKVNILKNGDYDFIKNNCAGAVDYALKLAGVKDLDQYGPDKLGMYWPAPGNNPFHIGIQEWCRKHGVQVFASELEQAYKHNYIANHQERADTYTQIHQRLMQNKAYKKSWKKVAKKVRQKIMRMPPKMLNNRDY